ncbi:hypothetical protein VSR69_38520 [Paraburkholderia phytofirmans]
MYSCHTMLGKMNGFTAEQIIETRRGCVIQGLVEAFFAAGWTKGNLVDATVIIGDKTVSNCTIPVRSQQEYKADVKNLALGISLKLLATSDGAVYSVYAPLEDWSRNSHGIRRCRLRLTSV